MSIKTDKAKTKKDSRHLELEDQLRRALADYQNLERRVEQEKKILGELYSAILIEKFLPILDNLENAQNHLKDEGLELVVAQFREILKKEGVGEIEAQGAHFDPKLHEAIETQEGENDGVVVRVISKGYEINGKVIRPAKVVVERKKVDETAEEKAEKAKEFGDYA